MSLTPSSLLVQGVIKSYKQAINIAGKTNIRQINISPSAIQNVPVIIIDLLNICIERRSLWVGE